MRPSTRYILLAVLPATVLPALFIPAVYVYVADTVETEPLLFATTIGIVVALATAILVGRLLVSPLYSTLEMMLSEKIKRRGNFLSEPKEALKMLEELVEELAGSVDVLIVAERDGRISYINKRAARLLGYNGGLLDTPLEHLFVDKKGLEDLLRRTNWDGRVEGVETELLSKDGRAVPVELSVSLLEGAGSFIIIGQDTAQSVELARRLSSVEKELTERIKHLEDFRGGILSVVKDLEESENRLHDAYMELKATQAQLVHSSKLKALGELTAGLAHELAQPLTAIRGLVLHMLKHKQRCKEYAGKLELINRATEKMENVISHLRMFSRIDKAVLKPVDLNRVVEDAFLIAGEMLKKTGINVVKRLTPLPSIMGNRGALEQVVINLISNAKDAMPHGGTLTISTDMVEKEGRVYIRLTVEDTGCGIPEEVLPRIFEPFFTTKDVDRGTGLGLSISYGIVKDHQGEILVDSRRGKGAKFSVLLPAR